MADEEKLEFGRPLTQPELEIVRRHASKVLSELDQDLHQQDQKGETYHSWVNGPIPDPDMSQRCRYFDEFGFLLVENFADTTEVRSLKQQMTKLTQDWDPAEKTISFRTDEESNTRQGSDDYFLESASRVHFFAEPGALDAQNRNLKSEFANDKLSALNKAGHGMHMIPGAFRDYATSQKVQDLVHELGWRDPVIPQSMYIFKQPRIGGAVNSHQDSTFLYTTPKQTCLGLWLALDDATLENGCLWVRPRSHHETVRRHFKRNSEYFGIEAIDEGSNIARGDLTQPKMLMETLLDDESVPWEGMLPKHWERTCEGLLNAGFVPIECKAGDLLAFPGEVDHLSLPNYSLSRRHTFQLHLVEGENAGVTWSPTNWLQYPPGTPFLSISRNAFCLCDQSNKLI